MTKIQKMKHGVNKRTCASKRVCFRVIDRRFTAFHSDRSADYCKQETKNTPLTQIHSSAQCLRMDKNLMMEGKLNTRHCVYDRTI